jgi:hypothetical protein
MTHSASEVFTMQLARAAGKQANKFLAARGLQKADRDDVIASAMLWCWENRAIYSLTTTLETWFMNAIRDAYKALRVAELPTSDESIENMGGGDETYDIVAAESAATALLQALPPDYKKIAALTMQGFTRRELMDKGHDQYVIDSTYARIRQLRRLVPDESRSKRLIQTAAAAPSDDADDKISEIDVAIEQLDFAPPAGKDCPPCWRCMWFEGFMPAGKRDTRMDIEDKDVREAVRVTEARKIEIAQQVRSGV